MAEIVLRQLHRVAVDDEAAVVDAVGIAAYRCAEVGGHVLVVGDVVKTQNHIAQLAVAVGYHERDDASAEIGDADLHADGIFQGIEGYRFPVDDGIEVGGVETRAGGLALLCAGDTQQ